MRKRSIKKQIWLNDKENEILKRKAKIAGVSEADLIRCFICGYKIKAQPTEEIIEFKNQIFGIANNINQIAKIANSNRYISVNTTNEIQFMLDDFIMRFENKIYSRER